VTATSIDLTPFGFTTTENRVYLRLDRGGPASGYAVARDLLIARANAYQALRGLVAKGAAVVTGDSPKRFRAVRQSDVFATIVERQTRQLNELENQIATELDSGAETFVAINVERGILDLAVRGLARESGQMRCMGPPRILSALAPAIRKRGSDGAGTMLWSVGDSEVPSAVAVSGSVSSHAVSLLFGSDVAMLVAETWTLTGRIGPREFLGGYWTSDPAIVGTARAAWAALTSGGT